MLPKDVMRCANNECPKCQECLRFLAGLDKRVTAWFSNFEPDEKGLCGHFKPLNISQTTKTENA